MLMPERYRADSLIERNVVSTQKYYWLAKTENSTFGALSTDPASQQ
jgi:hypothetical protein